MFHFHIFTFVCVCQLNAYQNKNENFVSICRIWLDLFTFITDQNIYSGVNRIFFRGFLVLKPHKKGSSFQKCKINFTFFVTFIFKRNQLWMLQIKLNTINTIKQKQILNQCHFSFVFFCFWNNISSKCFYSKISGGFWNP